MRSIPRTKNESIYVKFPRTYLFIIHETTVKIYLTNNRAGACL